MANTPSTPVTPLEGKTIIDDKMFFDPERLSYESAVEIATEIAHKIRSTIRGEIVVIAGTRLLADFANLQAVYVSLDSLRRDYESIGKQAESLIGRKTQEDGGLESFVSGAAVVAGTVSSVITPVTAVVGAALGLVSLFRQDVEYHGEKTLVDALAFEIALAAAIRLHGAKQVYVPDLVVLSAPDTKHSLLQTRFNQVQQAKAAAWTSVGPLISELIRLEAELDGAAKSKDQDALDRLSDEVSNMRRDLAPVADPLSRLDQRLSDLQNQLNQTESTSGLLVLARLLRAEALQSRDPVYLHATVVSSGGYYRVTRNLFRTLFMGDGLSFAGGATVRWARLGKDGSIESGGIRVAARKGKFGQRSQPEREQELPQVSRPNKTGAQKTELKTDRVT
ncbi:MAG TPA: hypothetical protein VNV41_18915 [Candidatus Acidoferrales bacterium]|jgi:hypothetical protein|nr:hypothetical protein [Candidatus Acidoferrales bacterium]